VLLKRQEEERFSPFNQGGEPTVHLFAIVTCTNSRNKTMH